MVAEAPAPIAKILGRYALGREIARGGLATVHIGLALGEVGFSRAVAIKRLLPCFASEAEFVTSFVEEAKLAARVRHPNVVPTLDVVTVSGEVFVVMEYVHGESLSALVQTAKGLGARVPAAVASALIVNALRGLHAAHEATDERGAPLNLVHRDVSPQNVLVGIDGVARVLDFGIAKAAGRSQVTREGQIKGKLAYMPPEQLTQNAERASDLYSVGVCLWEALTMRRLFAGDNESAVLAKILAGLVDRPSRYVADVSPEVDAFLLRALDRNPRNRFATARDMANALESVLPPASISEVAEWVDAVAGPLLSRRLELVTELERGGPSLLTDPASAAASLTPTPAPLNLAGSYGTTREEARPLQSADSIPTRLDIVRPEAPPRPSKPAWLAWTGRLALVAGGAALVFAALRIRAIGGSGEVVAPSSDASATVGDTLPLFLPSSAPSVTVVAAPPTSNAVATSIASAATPPPVPKGGPSVARALPRVPLTSSCDPPYSVDADGTRRYKKACLK